ncbi:MAG: protein translocase subunit SecD [Candidatus Coatesbacteria bacterium]|nr:protein translocase subunit SecD [Candidatus Coatesbacteria bacterium]
MARKRRFYGLLSILVFIAAVLFALPTTGLLDELPEGLRKYLPKDTVNLGLDLKGGMVLRMEADMSKIDEDEQSDAVDRALEIIRERVDEFGVSEPVVEKVGENGISVMLPGIRDAERAKALIGERAVLEFALVTDQQLPEVLAGIARLPKYADLLTQRGIYNIDGRYYAPLQVEERLEAMVEDPDIERFVPRQHKLLLTDEKLLQPASQDWIYEVVGKLEEAYGEPVDGFFQLHILDFGRIIKGEDLTNAYLDRDQYGKPSVSFEFNYSGSEDFAQITRNNVGGFLAIVLDDKVISSPYIREEINGRGQITGDFSAQEAGDLAIKLRAGALPVPLKIVMEDTIGPSLGSDSIKYGVTAALIGLAIVLVFMFVWYKASGLVADLALIINMIIVVAALALFGATLTLPGIAGIILTIGMAVDANVLIFERIREELRAGKNVPTAISAGYDKAFITILDANITTLITAGVLYLLGTGAIRGFAVTLAIGILSSMFTALIVTRWIFDMRARRIKDKRLSI